MVYFEDKLNWPSEPMKNPKGGKKRVGSKASKEQIRPANNKERVIWRSLVNASPPWKDGLIGRFGKNAWVRVHWTVTCASVGHLRYWCTVVGSGQTEFQKTKKNEFTRRRILVGRFGLENVGRGRRDGTRNIESIWVGIILIDICVSCEYLPDCWQKWSGFGGTS